MSRNIQNRRPSEPRHDPNQSHLLKDFLANRYQNYGLSDIISHVAEFARCNRGSKFIQKKLGDATDARKASVFNELWAELFSLSTDPSANFVIQKFFDIGSVEQKLELTSFIINNVWLLSTNLYGCRVVQKAIDKVPEMLKLQIVQNLQGHMYECALNPYGNHVIQNSFKLIPPSHLDFILHEFRTQVCRLSMDLYGCRVLQRILECGTKEQKTFLYAEMMTDIQTLVKHRYGNYVVQKALGLYLIWAIKIVIHLIKREGTEFCLSQYRRMRWRTVLCPCDRSVGSDWRAFALEVCIERSWTMFHESRCVDQSDHCR